MFSKPPSICIIGFGAFGEFLASLLSPHAHVLIHDRSEQAQDSAMAQGYDVIAQVSALSADIVILAVPVPALAECLRDIAPRLRAGQLIIDVCSIKEEPARLMHNLLPPDVEILATHPMFGPESARETITGAQIVLCPIRGNRWRRLAAFLRQHLRLEVIRTTPEEHDRQAAVTQGLTHLLARAVSTLGNHPRIRTRSFDLMTQAFAMVTNDAPEVFEAITRHNRHVTPLCEEVIGALSKLGAPDRDSSVQNTRVKTGGRSIDTTGRDTTPWTA